MMDSCHLNLSKSIESTTLRVNFNINYGIWIIKMCQYRFILGEKKKMYHSSEESLYLLLKSSLKVYIYFHNNKYEVSTYLFKFSF